MKHDDLGPTAPALQHYTAEILVGDLWKRPQLSPRDRSMITVAALIVRNHSIGMNNYFNRALDNGVKPKELSEIITHLAFYGGWASAILAASVAKDIYATRGI